MAKVHAFGGNSSFHGSWGKYRKHVAPALWQVDSEQAHALNSNKRMNGMKRELLKGLTVIIAASALGSGCVVHERVVHERAAAPPPGEVVVSTEPPAPKHEVIGVAPSPHHVWVDGYWVRSHDRWIWVSGRYEVGPHPGAVWVKGHWNPTDRGWVWVPGHWA
jgi:hypothetical protein